MILIVEILVNYQLENWELIIDLRNPHLTSGFFFLPFGLIIYFFYWQKLKNEFI